MASRKYKPTDKITLKWGTLKAWQLHTPEVQALMEQYHALGSSLGAMTQRDTPEQKDLICRMIDAANAKRIYLDWDGKYVSKDAAKDYVRNYRKS